MRVERSIVVARPQEDVFAFVVNLENLSAWQQEVVEVRVNRPLETGARYTEVRTFLGKRFESTVEVTALEPPTTFALRVVKGPIPISVRHTFEPDGTGTRIRIHGEGDESGLRGFTAALVGRQAARRLKADLARLKAVLEQADPPEP
jgi:uncharacterized membrane protein